MDWLKELEKRIGKKIKIGSKIRCLNPKHDDKEPSMHIYENHAYCFGCGFVFPPKDKSMIAESFQFLLNESAANVNKFHKIQPFFYDKNKIFWLWNWEKSCYEICDEIELLSIIDKKLGFQGSTIKKQVKQEYLDAFKLIGRRKKPKEPKKNWIQFDDFISPINIDGSPWGHEAGLDAGPDYFFTNPIPWRPSKSEKTPILDKLFEEWVGKKYIKTLYEIIAYCCYRDYPIHLCFCLIGSGRNGKTMFQKLLYKFLGENNCISTELDLLIENRFESFKLYKKLACQLGETNWGILNKTSLFKKLIGGDLIGFEKKNKDPFDGYNHAKIIINSNSLPTSADTSEGFYRRWLIINFKNEFPEGKNIIENIPDSEFNSLARKVIKILPKLLQKGKFTNQGTIEQRKINYMLASNPLPIFIKDFCEFGDDHFVKSADLYNAYTQFLKLNKKRKVSKKEFYESLSNEGFYSEKLQKNINGENIRTQFIEGLDLKNDWKLKIHEKVSVMSMMSLNSHLDFYIESNSKTKDITDFPDTFNKKDIIFHIERLGNDKSMPIEELIEYFGSGVEKFIVDLKSTGYLFEPKPGIIKIL